ncbi:hypothetical protein [Oxalicibacterium faecigallinarum]|uniref:hypothetical protein n=1 Tax=Oxalicibacterium faecigallinarum TaxID=573741 RepID=UPI00166A3C86|nr:hypothetical protein [Oxalicibacterium faecigallinarum]
MKGAQADRHTFLLKQGKARIGNNHALFLCSSRDGVLLASALTLVWAWFQLQEWLIPLKIATIIVLICIYS